MKRLRDELGSPGPVDPETAREARLLRAMVPLSDPPAADALAGKAALIMSGERDPIAAPADATRLKAMLEAAGAAVDHRVVPAGHELSQADVTLARHWLAGMEAALAAAS